MTFCHVREDKVRRGGVCRSDHFLVLIEFKTELTVSYCQSKQVNQIDTKMQYKITKEIRQAAKEDIELKQYFTPDNLNNHPHQF